MRRILVFSVLGFFAVSGCKERNDFDPPEFKDSWFHVASASSLVDTFSVIFDYWSVDDVVIPDYWFQKNWPISGYAELTAGGEPDEFGNGKLYVHAVKYISFPGINDTLGRKKDIILEPDGKSSGFFADSSGEVIFLKYEDTFTPPASGNTLVRFVNLEESVSSATLNATAGGALNISGISFRSASAYSEIASGTYTLQVVDEGTGSPVNTTTLDIAEGGAYTFYLGGAGSGSMAYYRH